MDSLEIEGLRLIAAHNNNVQREMANAIADFAIRMANHDQSKYSDAELDLVKGKPALQKLEYNTPEYKEGLAKVQTAVTSHYASNDHHPEHLPDGIADMSLLALLEMACDWKAASYEHGSTYMQSVQRNVERFNLSNEMQRILTATGIEMGWI